MNKSRRKMIRLLLCLTLALSWAMVPVVSHSSEPQNAPKPKLTALYLYNFLLFVDWPKDACSGSDRINVSIYRAPGVYEAMKRMSGKTVKGKKLVISSLAGPEDMGDACQVLFVGETETNTVKRFLERIDGKPVLTIGNRPGFIASGGMVSFRYPDDFRKNDRKRNRFIINLSAVQKSRLKIRSRLLRMADIVYEAKPVTRTKP